MRSHSCLQLLLVIAGGTAAFLFGGGAGAQAPPQAAAAWPLQAKDEAAAKVLLQMRQVLTSITSIHYTFDEIETRDPVPPAPFFFKRKTTSGEFAYAGGKYYSAFTADIDGVPNAPQQAAFDGVAYRRGRQTNIRKDIPPLPYVTQQPLLYALRFVRRPTDRLDVESIGNEDAWSELAARATLEAPRSVREHACEVVRFTVPEPSGVGSTEYEVCAAKDLRFYPISQTLKNARAKSTVDVTEVNTFESPLGKLVVPTRIEVISKNDKGHTLIKVDITVRVTSVNQPIPDTTFTLK